MPIGTVALISGGISFVSGLFGMSAAKAAEKKAADEKAAAQRSLDQLINDRQDVVNPYEGVTNLSSMLSNPMASLGVATQAAEMKVEEADISLANTLDTVRATGASAGGATALAQAALKSKKGVAASIEMQEKQNEDKRAQGQQQMEQRKMSEQQRLQSIAISEGQRMQSLDAAGKSFVFGQQEQRDISQLDRTASLLGASNQAEAQAAADRTAAITGGISALGSIAGGMAPV